MKKILSTIYLLLLVTLSFGQIYNNFSPVERALGKPLSEITPEEYNLYRFPDVPIEDYTKNDSVVFYASPEDATITVHYKETGKEEVYPFGGVPEKYFHFVDKDGYYAHYTYLLCMYNGKYGCVNKKGVIVEGFKWDPKEFNIDQVDEFIAIYNKDYSKRLKTIRLDLE